MINVRLVFKPHNDYKESMDGYYRSRIKLHGSPSRYTTDLINTAA